MKPTLRKEILSDLTKVLAENQKEMLKVLAPVAKKQTTLTVPEESYSEFETVRRHYHLHLCNLEPLRLVKKLQP